MNLPEPSSVERVAIISTGTIGASWAAHFLTRGMDGPRPTECLRLSPLGGSRDALPFTIVSRVLSRQIRKAADLKGEIRATS